MSTTLFITELLRTEQNRRFISV